MTRGMLKQNDAETNSFSSSFKYSSLPESVPFQVLENGDIISRKKIDYEKDPHWWEFLLSKCLQWAVLFYVAEEWFLFCFLI